MSVRYRRTFIATCVVCALTAFAATAAFAATTPELVNKLGNALVKKHFTLTSSEATYEFAVGTVYRCRDVTGEGEVTSKTTLGKVVLEFHECDAPIGRSCFNEKNITMIKTLPLSGKFGWINEERKEIGLQVRGEAEPQKFHQPILAKEVVCEGPNFNYVGYLVGLYTGSIHAFSTSKSFSYKQTHGVQALKPFAPLEEKSVPLAEYPGIGSENVGVGFSDALKFEEEAEFQ
jgi:hypothetical protein